MTIRTSRNLDDIKPGGLELLTKRQLLFSILTLIVAILVTVLVTLMGFNLTIAGYIGLIFAAPIGYVGFFKRNGMTLPEYRKARKGVNQPMLFYVSTENPNMPIVVHSSKEESDQKGFIEKIVSNMMKKKGRSQ